LKLLDVFQPLGYKSRWLTTRKGIAGQKATAAAHEGKYSGVRLAGGIVRRREAFLQRWKEERSKGRKMASSGSSASSSSSAGELGVTMKEEMLQLKLDKKELALQLEKSERAREKNESEFAKEIIARETKEKMSELLLKNESSEREKIELKAMNEKDVRKLKDSLKRQEKLLKSTQNELDKSIANEKEVTEKVEGLQRELASTKEPSIYELVTAYHDARNLNKFEDTAPLLDLHDRIVSISDERLRKEIRFTDQDGDTVFHIAARSEFPYAVLSRLVQCGCDINAESKDGRTAITAAMHRVRYPTFDNLALLGADMTDISIRDDGGEILRQLKGYHSNVGVNLLRYHGISEGIETPAGFVSPRMGMASPMPELHTKSISDRSSVDSCIRTMSLEMIQLRVEAREMNGYYGCYPMHAAASLAFPLRVVKRLQLAYPAGVNALEDEYEDGCGTGGPTALIRAAEGGNAELVDLLCEMGSCIGYRCHGIGDHTYNAFDSVGSVGQMDENEAVKEAKEAATLAVLAKHGVTSNVIPANYTSPLYYESIYFTQRVADANWAQFGMILMCMEEIDVMYRKRGERALTHLSKDAKCFFKVFCLIDGTDGLGNGIARILLAYIGGENMRERLTGVLLDPRY
jgi:hypothetical protein